MTFLITLMAFAPSLFCLSRGLKLGVWMFYQKSKFFDEKYRFGVSEYSFVIPEVGMSGLHSKYDCYTHVHSAYFHMIHVCVNDCCKSTHHATRVTHGNFLVTFRQRLFAFFMSYKLLLSIRYIHV